MRPYVDKGRALLAFGLVLLVLVALALLLGGTLLGVRSHRSTGWLLGGAIAALSLFAKESTLGLVLLYPVLAVLGSWTSPADGIQHADGPSSSSGSRAVHAAVGAYSVLLLFEVRVRPVDQIQVNVF